MIPRSDDAEDRGNVPRAGDFVTGIVRSSWPWLLGAGALLAFVGFLLWGSGRADDPQLPESTGSTGKTVSTPADGLAFTESARLIGESCLRLLVADSSEERSSGLRNREAELDRVDGMLFVLDAPEAEPAGFFTMSAVVDPLEIGFYGGDGGRLGGHVMDPCALAITECPRYDIPAGWQFAIETKPGKLPEGNLGAECVP